MVTTDAAEEFDVIVLGAGLRGLSAALRLRRDRPEARLLLVDAAAQPGGTIRTIRTNGFLCELGPFAFSAAELDAVTSLLPSPPTRVACLDGARTGHVFTGDSLSPVEVDPVPWTFRSGNEELVQACRRSVGSALRLGREAIAVDRQDAFVVRLGGEVPTAVTAPELVVALPAGTAGRLLGRFDPALRGVVERLCYRTSHMVWFGGASSQAPELRGYGIVPAESLASPAREAIFCSEVFPGRALAGRFLVRIELTPAATDSEADVLSLAERELRRWTGLRAELGLGKVHSFPELMPDGALVEARLRLRELPSRVPGLHLA